MRIFDCTTFYNEHFILDVRFNVLNPYVDKFIVCEAGFSHSGQKKIFNFDIDKFPKFKNKIIYLKIDKEPEDLKYYLENGIKKETKENARFNAIKRIAYQRNFLNEGIIDATDDDLILYSDNDEIPNLENIDIEQFSEKYLLFEQKLFYFKLNLYTNRINWFGTKGCKKKYLKSFEKLRQIKPKKYPFFRLDTFFKFDKQISLKLIKNGGWHFTRLQSPEEIHSKELDAEHHDEYRAAGKNVERIRELINNRKIDHDHLVDTKSSKYNGEFNLDTYSIDQLPLFIKSKEIASSADIPQF